MFTQCRGLFHSMRSLVCDPVCSAEGLNFRILCTVLLRCLLPLENICNGFHILWLPVVSDAALVLCTFLYGFHLFISLPNEPSCGIAGLAGVMFNLLRNCELFVKVAVVFTSLQQYRVFWVVWGGVSVWLGFAFPRWLVIPDFFWCIPSILLVWVQACIATLEISMAVSQKTENPPTLRPSCTTPGHIHILSFHKDTCLTVFIAAFFHNSQNL